MKKVAFLVVFFASFTASLYAGEFQKSISNKLFEQIPNVGLLAKSDKAEKNIETLLENGANPNAQRDGKTAVMHLIENTNNPRATLRVLDLLTDNLYNKDIDFIADNGMTALTFAASKGNFDTIEALKRAGAKPKNKDAYGMKFTDYIEENRTINHNELEKLRKERGKKYLQEKFKKEIEEFEEIPSKEALEEEEFGEWEIINGN